jgi:hypothetical protein
MTAELVPEPMHTRTLLVDRRAFDALNGLADARLTLLERIVYATMQLADSMQEELLDETPREEAEIADLAGVTAAQARQAIARLKRRGLAHRSWQHPDGGGRPVAVFVALPWQP